MANSAALQLMQMRQIMVANGDEPKKIWATEYGQPASIGGAAKQNEFVADMLLKWQELPFAGPMFIYTTRDRKTGSGRSDETLGIYQDQLDTEGRPADREGRGVGRDCKIG